MTKPR